MLPYEEDFYDAEFDEDELFYEEDDDAYPEIREVLSLEYQDLPAESIELLLESAGISAEDMEFSLKNAFKSIGKAVTKIAPKALPIVGGAVGTLFGGPAGTAIGTALGSAAGKAIGRAGAARPARGRRAVPLGRPGLPVAAGSPSAAQLLQLITKRPEILQGLLSAALGPAGRGNVRVGNVPVNPGAIANLVGVLANQAAAEYTSMTAHDGEGIPEYLLSADGELLVDSSVPEERAAVLLGLIEQAAWERAVLEDLEEEEDDDEIFEDTLAEFEEDLYDQMDLAELYYEGAWED